MLLLLFLSIFPELHVQDFPNSAGLLTVCQNQFLFQAIAGERAEQSGTNLKENANRYSVKILQFFYINVNNFNANT